MTIILLIYDKVENSILLFNSEDNQAVDRAYGQKNDVVVYRLMSCSDIEEHMYRSQVSRYCLYFFYFFLDLGNKIVLGNYQKVQTSVYIPQGALILAS